MHSTQKNGQWYFGMKIHIGADVEFSESAPKRSTGRGN